MPPHHDEQNEKPDDVGERNVPPWRSQFPTDFASGYMFARATPADEPNQIIEPPKPTA